MICLNSKLGNKFQTLEPAYRTDRLITPRKSYLPLTFPVLAPFVERVFPRTGFFKSSKIRCCFSLFQGHFSPTTVPDSNFPCQKPEGMKTGSIPNENNIKAPWNLDALRIHYPWNDSNFCYCLLKIICKICFEKRCKRNNIAPTKKYFLLLGVYSGSHSSSFGLFWKVGFELLGPVFVPVNTPLALPRPLIRNWITSKMLCHHSSDNTTHTKWLKNQWRIFISTLRQWS